jgi:hypothetical protein
LKIDGMGPQVEKAVPYRRMSQETISWFIHVNLSDSVAAEFIFHGLAGVRKSERPMRIISAFLLI